MYLKGGGNFHFGGNGPNNNNGLYHKQSITYQQFYSDILPASNAKPYIILFFSDWCFTCLRIEPIWSKLTEELEPVGFGVITVHSGRQRELARKIGSNELPHIAFLLDGKVVHYKDPQYSGKILSVIHSLIRGVLIQSCSAGAKKFTNYLFCHPQFSGVIQNVENCCAIRAKF